MCELIPVNAPQVALSALPVVAFFDAGSEDVSAGRVGAFRKGLSVAGYVEGQNVTVEYHWLEGQFDGLPVLIADLVRRRVAVIATPGSTAAALAAKGASATIPIIFGVGQDPVKTGLVASLSRPGGNATGINFFVQEVVAKRLALLHQLVPKAVRVAVVVNPANVTVAEATLRDVQEAARVIGLQIQVQNASTPGEIDAVLATLAHERPDALFVATLAARDRIPATFTDRETVAAGGLRLAPVLNMVSTAALHHLLGARVRSGSSREEKACQRWRQLSPEAAVAATASTQRLAATLLNLPRHAHNVLGTSASSSMCRSGLKLGHGRQ